MKSKLILFSVLGILVSCDKGEVEPSQQPPKLRTDNTITVTNVNSDTTSLSSEKGVYNLLGYGYDVTGEFADVSAARHQIIDVEKVKAEAPTSVEIGKTSSGSSRFFSSENCESYSNLVSSLMNETKDSNLFRGSISAYFPEKDAFSGRYIYASYTYMMTRKFVKMMSDRELLQKHQTLSFKSDVQRFTSQEIVKKYGTHVLTGIILGSKLSVLYQAETENRDREDAADIGLSIAMKKVFGLFSGNLDYMDSTSATGNFAQRLSFKTTGGDMRKVSQTTTPGAKHSTINLSDWVNSIATADDEFIDLHYGHELIPLYDIIEDPVKKEEVRTFIQAYLIENQVKL